MTKVPASVDSPLVYFGAKVRLAPWIISHFPSHNIYCEPFGGSAAVLLKKRPAPAEIYNDLFPDIVNFFRVLRDPYDAARLKDALDLTPYALEEYKIADEFRNNLTKAIHPVEHARMFFLRCEMGFGSSGAISSAGFSREGPGGRRKVLSFRNKIKNLPKVTARLLDVQIDSVDALSLFEQYDSPETLFYVDPPYVMETRKDKSSVYAHEYTEEDHEKLLTALCGCEGMVVLSEYSTDQYDDALKGWERVTRNDIDQAATTREEVLWINPQAIRARAQISLF